MKKQHGGARPGSGRKKKEPKVNVSFKVDAAMLASAKARCPAKINGKLNPNSLNKRVNDLLVRINNEEGD